MYELCLYEFNTSPISSLQVKILRIIKKNNGLKESKIYNI